MFIRAVYQDPANADKAKVLDPSPLAAGVKVFFLPGIIGLEEMKPLMHLFNQITNGQYSSYIKLDPRNSFHRKYLPSPVKPNNETKDSLQKVKDEDKLNYVESIANEIIKTSKAHEELFIVGYSIGGTWSGLVTEYLRKKGRQAHAIIIDAPTPKCTQELFQNNPKQALVELTNIINFAATQVKLKQQLITEEEINAILALAQDQRIDAIASLILAKQVSDDIQKTAFLELVKIIKEDFDNLLNYKVRPSFGDLGSPIILTTSELSKKYGEYAGWDDYTSTIGKVTKPSLLKENHLQLLAPGAKSVSTLAILIKESIKKIITPTGEDLITLRDVEKVLTSKPSNNSLIFKLLSECTKAGLSSKESFRLEDDYDSLVEEKDLAPEDHSINGEGYSASVSEGYSINREAYSASPTSSGSNSDSEAEAPSELDEATTPTQKSQNIPKLLSNNNEQSSTNNSPNNSPPTGYYGNLCSTTLFKSSALTSASTPANMDHHINRSLTGTGK